MSGSKKGPSVDRVSKEDCAGSEELQSGDAPQYILQQQKPQVLEDTSTIL